MLLPGQIESWAVLTDLGKNGLGNLSITSLKQVLNILQANYRCRLGINYIINPPKSIWMMWSCIKPFLDDITIEKIKISNASYSPEMMTFFNPYQVEEKYGGKGQNLIDYWPPYVPNSDFAVCGKQIILSTTKDSYSQYNPIEIVEEEPPTVLARTKTKVASRVNSLDVSVENSDVAINEIEDDIFARSDVEDPEENLVDFEMASPFTRKFERNPTFMLSGLKSSEDFQKKLSIKMPIAEAKKDKTESLESSVDFEPDPSSNIFSHEQEIQKKEIIEMNSEDEAPQETNKSYCNCGKIECGLIKNSCIIA